MKKKNYLNFKGIFTLLLSVLTLSVSAQNITVRGTVTDNRNEPVIGATIIMVNDASRGTVTDIDGNYVLSNVPGNGTLEFRYVGMTTQKVLVNGRTTINVVLSEDSEMLSEVVVTALGITKQARSVGYATTNVSTTEIERINAINPITALQGKVAGLDINLTGASGVTSSSSITIRGAKSIDKNNSPIFVVDGMIIQEPLRGALDGTDWGSQLKNLNPADYESVTVLKGAAATALYGSRGANGAIVIKSKGGKYGKQGLGVEISQILETTNIYKSPIELQNVYGAGAVNNGYEGGFLADGSLQQASTSFGPKMDGSMINQYLPHGQATPFVAHPDNWKSLYQSGLNSTTNVAINGGGEKSSFRLSYSYTDNNGVFKRNKFTRNSISFRGLTELNDVFTLEAGVNYAFSRAQNGANQGGWNWGGNLGMMSTYYTPRNMDIAAYESLYRDPVTKAVETTTPWGTLRGYLHNRDMNLDQRSENSLLSNVTLRAKIAPKLTASLQGNYNYYGISTMWQSYGQGANYGPTGSGGYGRGGNNSGSYNFLGMLQSMENKLQLGDETITVDGILAAELYGNTESHSWNKSTNGGLVSPAVFAFANSVNRITPNFDYTPRNNQAFGLSAILNFAWRDQLFLEITGRNDWLSTLTYPSYMETGMNNYTVFYPSANASWVFTDTFDTPDWLSYGKLRASLSRVGMGTAAYATTRGFGVFSQSAQYDPNRESVLIANPNLGTAWNNDLKPEIQQSIELGTDLRFFDERLNIDFAYYKTNTKNQILTVEAVTEAGASSQLINAGNIQNQGVELMIEGTPVRTADLRWTVGTNFSLNRGKIIELDENVKEWRLMGQYDGGPEIWAYEGGKFGVITTPYNNPYGAAIARFENDADPADPRNGKPLISYWGKVGSPNSVPIYGYTTNYDKGVPDRVELGKVEPDFLLSFNTSFSYKNFDFYALVDGRVGGNFFSNTYKYASSRGTLKSSLYGRDQENGGWQRTNYKGETVYDVYPLDGVFDEGSTAPLASNPNTTIDVSGLTYKEALEKGIRPMPAGAFYTYNLGWGMPAELGLQDNTWFALREITLGYRLPESVLDKLGVNYFRIGLTGRNLGYLINKLTDGLNPASISNNNPLTPMDIGTVPFARTYAVNFTLRF
ncbi:MAG: SusC/RagA family TonB-linked outer membrane protein [Bacteroidetes bacterium GWD2_45_23]|nr:MAG: SusC/RagA family TonB-linked outer membrane protein [Bacteroidetes bacterium GWC2_46_850]OFX71215.1 MAG: SusC/RagA family TonB-linked outer membrane protein [Bacteroidetes bacterium GWC1_47_7]OFX87289.1 MAG: SusC/RagA family TonB-linked outer membrane protein [Bacteroidetes bacterium GWD2_45_23]HAR38247.1 SusC/RagA family TonB-linked outer membrane protein [Porphyromonadaceae bacterium]HBB01687.1 SusC/RagA family TonB-linked outer membrane protein [Porphyromonadaceae bacterium]